MEESAFDVLCESIKKPKKLSIKWWGISHILFHQNKNRLRSHLKKMNLIRRVNFLYLHII